MDCTKCGAAVREDQAFCSVCGQATRKLAGSVVAEAAEQARYEQAIKRLSRFWLFFAALNVVLGSIGLFAIQTGMTMQAGPWEPWPHPYIWNWTLVGTVAWMLLSFRIVASIAAWWGLTRHTDWSRHVTMVAAAVAFVQFPIGFALAIYTLPVLWGKRHAELYARLGSHGTAVGAH